MSEDARSAQPKGPRKNRPRILVVNNPGDSSEDETIVNNTYSSSYGYQHPGHPPSTQSALQDRPSQSQAHIPAPLTTDLPPEHRHVYPSSRSNPSNPALSSPSSSSSPAIESTPPPSTPGQTHPPVDLAGDASFRSDTAHLSNHERSETTPQFPSPRPTASFDRVRSPPSNPLRPANGHRMSGRPSGSSTTSLPESFVSPTGTAHRPGPGPIEKVTLLVTADAETLKTVDITGARDAAFIRERIFTKLQISDEDQPRFSIYRTEIGEFAIGDALTDDQLFDLYRNSGDDKGTIKLLVSHSHAPVHEPSPESSLVSPTTVGTIPPPVLPQHSLYTPLRPRRPLSKSRRGSLSSTSERMPQDIAAAGYDASVSDDLDHGDRDNRRPATRPPHQHSNPLPLPPRPRSPSSYARPNSPGLATTPEQRTPVMSPESHTAIRLERGHAAQLPTLPYHQATSPQSARFYEESSTLPQWHNRTHSDAFVDRDRYISPQESNTESDRQWRTLHGRDTEEKEDRDRMRRRDSQSRREAGARRKGTHYDADSEQQKRRGEGWTVVPPNIPSSDYKKERPQDVRSNVSSRFSGATSGHSSNLPQPPRCPPPQPPSAPKQRGKAVPASWPIAWRGAAPTKNEPKPTPPSPWTARLMTKSMNDLRGTYKQQQQPQQQPQQQSQQVAQVPTALQPGRANRPAPPQLPIVSRPSTSSSTNSVNTPGEIVSPYHENASYGEAIAPKLYENTSRSAQSPVNTYHASRPTNTSGFASGTSGSGYLAVTSPSQDPYPRPRSAQGGEPLTPPYRTSQSPRVGETLRSPPTQPYYLNSGLSANTSTSSYEDGSYNYGFRSPPLRPDPDYSSTQTIRPIAAPRSPVALAAPPSDIHTRESDRKLTPEQTQVQRTLSSLPVREDDSTESTLRREDYSRVMGVLESQNSTLIPAKPRTPSPSLVPLTNRTNATESSTLPSTSSTVINFPTLDDDSDSEGGGTIWAKKPDRSCQLSQPPWHKPPAAKATHSGRPVLPPISTDSSPSSTSLALPNASWDPSQPTKFPAPPDFIPPPPPLRPRKQYTGAGNDKRIQDQRTSRFDNNFDYTWAPRPPPEEVFDNLQEYFPEHDVDKPVIEAGSGGTSPTSTEPSTLLPPTDRQKFRHKKSIRVVAAEHKRRVDRTSRMEPTVQASLRKRNTKLWGSRLEEVTSEGTKDDISAADASPGGAKPIFRWVRGELIGRGTYGKVYLALNATTGEMIAVKQVEIPRTASDKNDSRQVSVVEALKLESETLKDLDHPNIVQYLGFEETATFLSIFLEYVPGGSIASCLRKHGKFDEEVTKSFTGQILSGLEYLHSKGILHRDLKADNILVETSGICKISDFGISKRTDDINMIGAYTSMQGTVFWMAPEVINSQKKGYNSKIDIWSVGCVVFEMWSGQRPWNGQEAMAVLLHLYQTRQGPPVPPDITLSPLADEFRRKCFAMDPDERPSAAELQQHQYLVLQPDWAFNGFK